MVMVRAMGGGWARRAIWCFKQRLRGQGEVQYARCNFASELPEGAVAGPERRRWTTRMIVAPAVLSAGLVVVAAAGGAQGGKPGFFPRPLFRTPASAAYCYADLTGFEDGRASLT